MAIKGSIRLGITRLLKGKYSLPYYEKYIHFRNQPPYKEPLNEHFVAHNSLLFIKKGDYRVYKTDLDIVFTEVPFLSSKKMVLEHYGNTYQFAVHKLKESILSIYAYNNRVNSEKSKSVLYLIDNRMIMGEYLFNEISEKKYRDIFLHYLFKKYVKTEFNANEVIYIEDKNNNQICINWNGFDLSIKYLSADAFQYIDDLKYYYNTHWRLIVEKPSNRITDDLEIPEILI